MTTTNPILKFITQYSKKDFERIAFDWNGKHGDDFHDKNFDFRMQVCEFLKNDFTPASDQLIIDLYSALSESAGELWGVYESYHEFANELLKRGGKQYFDHYVKGAMISMDTAMASGQLDLSKKRVYELLDHIKTTLAKTDNAIKNEGYEYMLERFEWLAQKDD